MAIPSHLLVSLEPREEGVKFFELHSNHVPDIQP